MADQVRVVVTGLAVTYPFGGVFWDYMNYVLGFHLLGHDVLYLEDTGLWCYEPGRSTFQEIGSENAALFDRAIRELEPSLAGRWFFRDAAGTAFGMPAEAVVAFCQSADLFVNVSAAAILRDDYMGHAKVVFIDTDPMYTQASIPDFVAGKIDDQAKARLMGLMAHDLCFTLAENIGASDCEIPTELIEWVPTRQPIVLDAFGLGSVPVSRRRRVLTTIGSWKPAAEPVRVNGREYWGKGPEFERFLDLPARSPLPLELAMSGDLPRDRLIQFGWQLVDPLSVSADPWLYRDYVAHSWGEWSVAKDAYVSSRSGWFSCRSACYLAAGVPVIVQDTGFASVLPVGEGILPFTTMEEAVAGIQSVESDYGRHSRAAREIAEEFFDSGKVLTGLIEDAFRSTSAWIRGKAT